jgi:hemolysin D
MIRILLVDDQKSVRERLKSLLETEEDFEIVGMADNGYDAIEQVKLLQPDVVLMDMEMPDIDGVLATKIISHSAPQTKVLVLSSHDSNEYVAKSIYAGAKGYILKGAPAQELRDAVRFVDRGYMQIAPGLFEKFMPNSAGGTLPPPSGITPLSAVKSGSKSSDNVDRRLTPSVELTGFEMVKAAPAAAMQPAAADLDFDRPSELILDITAERTGRSIGWYQAGALILAGLGLTGGLYLLRQGLNNPTPTLTTEEQNQQLQETPFTGKVEPQQVTKINATVPGFITEVKVKTGDAVAKGDILMAIRNVDAERANNEKVIQQQQANIQQEKAAQQQATQQQAVQQQQLQTVSGQQQAAQQRVNDLKLSIQNYNSTLAPLRQQVAAANVQAATVASAAAAIPLRQKQEAINRAKAIYTRNTATYQRLAEYQASGAISQERLSQAQKDMEVAQFDLNSAQADYDAAVASNRANASKQASLAKQTQLQQQLSLKEQEGQLRQLQEQLRVAQSDYQQLSTRRQQLQKQSVTPATTTPATAAANLQPVIVTIAASTDGTIVELPINAGDQIFTGNKLIGIANVSKLKVTMDIEVDRAKLLKAGQTALIKVGSGVDAQELTGTIGKIDSPNEAQKQKVEIDFTNPKPTAIVGQAATVYFNP